MDARELPASLNLEQINNLAEDLVKTYRSGDSEAMLRILEHYQVERPLAWDELVANVQDRLVKLPDSDIRSADAVLADAQWAIAREYGFEGWSDLANHVQGINREGFPVWEFESAVDAVISGDVTALESLLRGNPELIRARSMRRHRATLLHYVAANGVEDFRQKSPKNSVTLAEMLLKAGAEVDASAETYGGGSAQTTLNLLVSSCHPAEAGVQAALVETLLDFGAAINGVEDDGSPLITALAFGYTDAADALARRGARVDTIAAAAGLGREDLVRSFVDNDGSLKPEVPLLDIGWLRLPKDPKANLELALVWAIMHDRTGVVEFLLQKGIDPGARNNWGAARAHDMERLLHFLLDRTRLK